MHGGGELNANDQQVGSDDKVVDVNIKPINISMHSIIDNHAKHRKPKKLSFLL